MSMDVTTTAREVVKECKNLCNVRSGRMLVFNWMHDAYLLSRVGVA